MNDIETKMFGAIQQALIHITEKLNQIQMMSQPTMCLQCIGEHKAQVHMRETARLTAEAMGEDYIEPDEPLPGIQAAVTLAPSWGNMKMGMQMIFGVTAVPVCYQHIDAKEKTPEEKAIAGGLLLGGPGAPPPGPNMRRPGAG